MDLRQTFDTNRYEAHLHARTSRRYAYTQPLESGDWDGWRRELRAALAERLGLKRIREASSGTPFSPRLAKKVREMNYTLEKGYVTSEPGIEIPFYLLLPASGEGPFPLVLTPHGHVRRGKEIYTGRYESEREREETEANEHDIALQAVAAGYAVIAPDVRGFAEMARAEDMAVGRTRSCDELQRRALLYGRTLIGERVHDLGVLIDYAVTRPEIDTRTIIVTGDSGGGTVTLFAAALDDRISIAVPGSYFCLFRDSIVKLRHCSCNIIPGIMELGEMYDIAALIAPKPLLVVHGKQDDIYPIQGTREAFAHVRRVYEELGYPERCELYEGEGGHRYYKARVWPFVKERLAGRVEDTQQDKSMPPLTASPSSVHGCRSQ